MSRIDPRTGSVRSIHVGNQPAALAPAGGGVLVTVLPSLASHRGGTLTLIAQLSPHDQTTDPAAAWQLPEWQMLSVTNDGLVGYRRTGGPAGDTPRPRSCDSAPRAGRRRPDLHLPPPPRHQVLQRDAGQAGRLPPRDRARLRRQRRPAGYYTGIIGAAQCERTPGRCDLARGIVTNDQTDTVTFHLTAPDPEFLYKLAFPFADAVPAGTA